MTAVSEIWVSWFGCCVPQPRKHRIRIDRATIGAPTNFQHTAHIGSRDVEMPNDQLTALQMQMRSKGGYQGSYKVSTHKQHK